MLRKKLSEVRRKFGDHVLGFYVVLLSRASGSVSSGTISFDLFRGGLPVATPFFTV